MPRILSTLFLIGMASTAAAQQSDIQFNRDIRSLLANNCFKCHGPDAKARKAKLRLDTRKGMLAARKHGHAIVPGKPDDSLLVYRIFHEKASKRMPPEGSGKSLSSEERALLRRWVRDGAPWQDHWSFESLKQPEVPKAVGGDWPRNEIDRFLVRHLHQNGVRPAPKADVRTLIRRLHFDLVGLPPAHQVAAESERSGLKSYEKTVDALLESKHHAERLTMYWLDLVRYGDTSGIHGDQVIPMSPFRDWVIQSFHENKPFDEFTREQLAGDLLPDPTLKQRVASGYNRLNMKTAEGGAQEKEYLAKYAADRVRTTATTWLGATLGCAECHDHKFDPYTTKDFYRFEAFFADLDHQGLYAGANSSGNWGPKVSVPSAEQTAILARLDHEIAALETELESGTPEIIAAQRAWEARTRKSLGGSRPPILGPWRAIGPFRETTLRRAHDKAFGPERDAKADRVHQKLRWSPRPDWKDGKIHQLKGANSATYLYRVIESPVAQSIQLSLGSDDSIKVWLNGVPVLSKFTARGVKPGQEKPAIDLAKGKNALLMKITNGGGDYGFYFKVTRSGPPAPIVAILEVTRDKRTSAQIADLAKFYRSLSPLLAKTRKQIGAKRQTKTDLLKKVPTTLVSRVRKTPRVIRVLPRGDWMNASGEIVSPGVPAFLPQPKADTKRLTRLDLANWITSPENPLTARVFVNRMWRHFFGQGLCKTLDDVGSQGAWPSNLELLDWLAADFRKDWNVRRLIKQIVMSAAYRQSSNATSAARERDPENRFFARQGRFRHDAEIVRDQVLAMSGLLNRTIGGPSVKPYQPAGHWAQLNFPRRTWKHDVGDSQYRRGLYTHWQRTFLHPSMRAFDAPSREECTAERARSNTPLQALVLLNDPTYVEAARVFAATLLQGPDRTFDQRLTTAFRRVLSRGPTQRDARTLRALWREQHAHYTLNPDEARKIASVGLHATSDTNPAAQAAWTAVTRVLFNLHETITRY
jgi:mono/diheme cytochrome c family protein